MNDPFPLIWADKLAKLPVVLSCKIYPEPNTDCEHLSCLVCGRGDDKTKDATEWLVTMRSPYETITRGLHEACRVRQKD